VTSGHARGGLPASRTRLASHSGRGRRHHRGGRQGLASGRHRRHHREAGRRYRGRHGRRHPGVRLDRPRGRHLGHRGLGRRHLARPARLDGVACCSGWASGRLGAPCQRGWAGQAREHLVGVARQAVVPPGQEHPRRGRHLARPGPGGVRRAEPSPCRRRRERRDCCPAAGPDAGHRGNQAWARQGALNLNLGLRSLSRRGRASGLTGAGLAPGRAAAPVLGLLGPAEPARGPAGPAHAERAVSPGIQRRVAAQPHRRRSPHHRHRPHRALPGRRYRGGPCPEQPDRQPSLGQCHREPRPRQSQQDRTRRSHQCSGLARPGQAGQIRHRRPLAAWPGQLRPRPG
jgi:hypothetical protein